MRGCTRDAVVNSDSRFTKQYKTLFRVRRQNVLVWLQFLQRNNPDYSDIQIDFTRINGLPEDGDISSDIPTVFDDTSDTIIVDTGPILEDTGDTIEVDVIAPE